MTLTDPAIGQPSTAVAGTVTEATDATLVAPGKADWWKSAVVYQVYPRSFADSDGDGIGDLPGVLSHVDHLAALGVDVVWLSPIYPSPQADNGYDISDYRAVDPVLGSLADFDELLAALHSRGIKLVMDLVVNHTSDQHPWFSHSRSSRDSPYRDWYWWRPPRPGHTPGATGAEPTNWRSFFGGPTWTLDEASGEYFLHLFSAHQPDLNWENPAVRHEVCAIMRWWLDRGVDGFRMDVINLISKTLPLTDATPAAGDDLADGFPHFAHGPRLHEFLSEMRRDVFAGRSGQYLTVGEMPGVTNEQVRLLTDPARGEVDMVFQFDHVQLDHGAHKFDPRPLRLVDLKASLGGWQHALAKVGWNSLYWNNHDQPRAVSRFGDPGTYRRESATMLATVLYLHCGTPYIYQGEELGMVNADFTDPADYRDIESLNYYREGLAAGHDPALLLDGLRRMSRDNARTPMQWDATANAGFTTGSPWISVNPDHTTVNAVAQRADPASVFHYYRRLIALRHRERVLTHGSFTMLLPEDPQVYAYTRHLGGDEVLVLGNFSSAPATLTLPDIHAEPGAWQQAQLLLSNTGTVPVESVTSGRVPLAPWQALVYKRTESDPRYVDPI